MRIFFIVFLLASLAWAGTNTLTSVSGGKVQTSHVNQFYTALNQDINPRNSLGVVTDLGGSLGQSSKRFNNAYLKTIVLGEAADSMSIDDNATSMRFKVGGNTVFQMSSAAITTATLASTTTISSKASLPALGQQISSSSGTGTSTSSTSLVDVTNLSVAITTTGRPVFVGMISADTAGLGSGYISIGSNNPTVQEEDAFGVFVIDRGGAIISGNPVNLQQRLTTLEHSISTMQIPCSSIWFIDVVAAGTYTYKIRQKVLSCLGGTCAVEVRECKLVALEM